MLTRCMGPDFVFYCCICSTDKNKPQGGAEATPGVQKQTQDTNVTALISSVNKLQQEKNTLQKEKDELLAKLAARMSTKGGCCYCGAVVIV